MRRRTFSKRRSAVALAAFFLAVFFPSLATLRLRRRRHSGFCSSAATARLRNGNRLVREEVELTPVTGSGSITFPGGPTVDLDCDGVSGINTVFRNHPRAELSVSDVSQAVL